MSSPESQIPLKLGILLRWLSANDSISFTANIKWFDWITTNFKPGDIIAITDAINKLGEFEDKLNMLLPKKQRGRTKAGRRRVINLPLFSKEGTSRNQTLRLLDLVVDENTGIILTFEDIKQIIGDITSSTVPTVPTVSTIYITNSYAKAIKWVENISPDISCFYKNTNGTIKSGGVGSVAVADALSLLVEPYSYGFGYIIENGFKIDNLYKKLLCFKQDDEFGTGFLPGDDVPLCQMPIVESTAVASIALCNYYSYLEAINKTEQLDEVKNEIKTTVKWLMNAQFEEGYWSTYKSDDYKPYPNVQATQLALVALSIHPVLKNIDTKECIKTSIKYLFDRTIIGGWGKNFVKKHDIIATTRIIWALMAMRRNEYNLEPMYNLDVAIETSIQSIKKNLEPLDKYTVEEIFIPQNGIRSRSYTEWHIPAKPFIISTLLRYYKHMKNGKIDEDMEKFIQDGILEILTSQQEFGGWLGTEHGITEHPAPSSTYINAAALLQKTMQDYTYLKNMLSLNNALKVME